MSWRDSLFKVEGFTNVDEASTSPSQAALDNAAVADGLGVLLVIMCAGFLLACAVAGVAEIVRKVKVELSRSRAKGVASRPLRQRSEQRRRGNYRRDNGPDSAGSVDVEMQALDAALFAFENPMISRGGSADAGAGAAAPAWRTNPLAPAVSVPLAAESKEAPGGARPPRTDGFAAALADVSGRPDASMHHGVQGARGRRGRRV